LAGQFDFFELNRARNRITDPVLSIAGVVFVFGPTPPKSKGRDGEKEQRLFDIGGPGG
jgi:hypothetical protein